MFPENANNNKIHIHIEKDKWEEQMFIKYLHEIYRMNSAIYEVNWTGQWKVPSVKRAMWGKNNGILWYAYACACACVCCVSVCVYVYMCMYIMYIYG